VQQFTVPQFIDVEDKVIGPITVRQFLIIMGASVLIAVCYKLFYFNAFLIATVIILMFTGTFAFGKVNGLNFHLFFLSFLITQTKPKVRVWNNSFGKENLDFGAEKAEIKKEDKLPGRSMSNSRLAELSLIVDTQGVFRGNDPSKADLPNFEGEVHGR
jgi:hypothetical protein